MRDIERFLGAVRHSASGRDGIPFEAWRQSGHVGVCTLYCALRWLCNGGLLDLSFNECLQHFIPKKELPNDKFEVQRTAFELRPIGLKNTDNKIIGGICNWKLRRGASKSICRIQRGFVFGRNFLNNIVDLDTASRCYALEHWGLMPILAAFDFGTAFPSLSQDWLFLVLRILKLRWFFLFCVWQRQRR